MTGIPTNGNYGIVSGERGLRLGALANTKGNSIGEGQDLLVIGRGRGTQQHAGEGERVDR